MKDSYERGQRGVIIAPFSSYLSFNFFSIFFMYARAYIITGRTGSYVPVVANFFKKKKKAKPLRFKKGHLYLLL